MRTVHCSPVLGVSDKWQQSLDITPTDQVNKVDPWPGDQTPICGNGDCLASHLAKGWRATESCFAFIGACLCGVLMDNAG